MENKQTREKWVEPTANKFVNIGEYFERRVQIFEADHA